MQCLNQNIKQECLDDKKKKRILYYRFILCDKLMIYFMPLHRNMIALIKDLNYILFKIWKDVYLV